METGERLLTDAEKAHFMEMESMFNSPGWAHLTQSMQQQIDQIPLLAFWNAKNFEELNLQRVRMQELTALVQMPLLMEQARENLIQQRASQVSELIAGQFGNE